MPKLIKEEVAKPIAEEVIAGIRAKHPELDDAKIRAVLNAASKMTAPRVKKIEPAPSQEPAPAA